MSESGAFGLDTMVQFSEAKGSQRSSGVGLDPKRSTVFPLWETSADASGLKSGGRGSHFGGMGDDVVPRHVDAVEWREEHAAYVRAGDDRSDVDYESDRDASGSTVEGSVDDCGQPVPLLSELQDVMRNAYDERVVQAVAGNTTALRAYFERAESLAVSTMGFMVDVLKTTGVRLVGNCSDAQRLVVQFDEGVLKVERPEVFEYPSGFCYLEFSRDSFVRKHVSILREWPSLLDLLDRPFGEFDVPAMIHASLVVDGVSHRVHAVPGGGVNSALAHFVGAAREHAATLDGNFKHGSLGRFLLSLVNTKPVMSGCASVHMRIGGDDDASGLSRVQNAVVDDLLERCEFVKADRSRLWEALQLAGNGVTELHGRPLLTGNKVLGMYGDALLKAALVSRGMHLRAGDIQHAVADVLSNSCLAQAAKVWMVEPLLQGSLGGNRASDYVLATAIEAIAAACYYGGGMESVGTFLEHVAVFTGRGFRYPWLVPTSSSALSTV